MLNRIRSGIIGGPHSRRSESEGTLINLPSTICDKKKTQKDDHYPTCEEIQWEHGVSYETNLSNIFPYFFFFLLILDEHNIVILW